MPKKPETLEAKLKSTIRRFWLQSKERQNIITQVTCKCNKLANKHFHCLSCSMPWEIKMAEVVHILPLGRFNDWQQLETFITRMFFGPQQVIDKACYKKVMAEQIRKK